MAQAGEHGRSSPTPWSTPRALPEEAFLDRLSGPMRDVRDARMTDLIAIDDRILDAAGTLEPQVLRTLDAVHLATALAVGDDLEVIVTYDDSMLEAARLLGLSTATPR